MLALALASACATVPPPAAPTPREQRPSAKHLATVDWQKAGDEAFVDLRTYLMAPSMNPPGNEKLAALVLEELLAKDGIEATLWPIDADTAEAATRVNLVARLPAQGAPTEGPLCLVSHMDVVTHEEKGWPQGRGPYEGFVGVDEKSGEETLWGRGALDMKGMGLLEVEVLRWLKRLAVPLKRDVIVLAVADEEVASLGMVNAVEKHWDELKCAHSINEGGMGVRDGLFEGQTAFTISVGEKGVLWLRMNASGPPGHGSTPTPGRAPQRLMEAVNRIAAREDKPRIIPPLYELLAVTGREAGGAKGFILERPALVDTFVTGTLLESPLTRAIITDTVNLTGFAGAQKPNVIPATVYAQYDIRLLPGTKPEDVEAELRALVGDVEGISFERLDARLAAVSEYQGDALYEAMAFHAVDVATARGEKRVVAGPLLSPGFTDSIFLREKGTKAYGFVPFIVNAEELNTMHGDAERVSKKNVTRGLETLLKVVVDVSAR
jgi:acetylornithine deacetylase/succinyl-diaminopimelate desuccinylase-like protein